MSVAEAATALRVHPRTIERRIAGGKIQSQRGDDGLLRVLVNLPDAPDSAPDGSTSTTQELGELADQATAAAYSGNLDGGNPSRCEDLRGTLQHRAVARLPITRRLVWRFLPVSLRA